MSLLSAALKGASSGSSLPSFSPINPLALSANNSNEENDLEVDFFFGEETSEDEPSSPAASSPRETSAAQQQASMMPFIPSALSSAPSWDVPAPSGLSATAAVARTASACMARSLPRPISGIRRTHSVALDDTEREGFVPPHLAVSMVEPQMCESLSTAKGAAALRLRSTTLRRTGYLEGRIGTTGTAALRTPSS